MSSSPWVAPRRLRPPGGPRAGLALALLCGQLAWGAEPLVSVSRSVVPDTVLAGQSVQVELTVRVGAVGTKAVRGFFLSEHVPVALTATAGEVLLDGQPLDVRRETEPEGAVVSGATTARWVLETPPGWSEGKALGAASVLSVRYALTVEATTPAGPLPLGGFGWVGVRDGVADGGELFGFEASPPVLQVRASEALPSTDGGTPGPRSPGSSFDGPGLPGSTAGCHATPEGLIPWLALGLALALWRPWRRWG